MVPAFGSLSEVEVVEALRGAFPVPSVVHGRERDGDVLLSASAKLVASAHANLVIATGNASHLLRFAAAAPWREIVAQQASS